MGGALCCCKDDVKAKQELNVRFRSSIDRWMKTVVIEKPVKDAQISLAELVDVCVSALGMLRVEAKNFCDAVALGTKNPRVISCFQTFLPLADTIHADLRKVALLRAWLSFDKDNSGDLSLKELDELVSSLNFESALSRRLVDATRVRAGAQAKPVASGSSGMDGASEPMLERDTRSISFLQFEAAFNSISYFDELSVYWDELHGTDSAPDISETKVGLFLRASQNETNFQSEAKRLIAALNGSVTKDRFIAYLSSTQLNNALDTVRANAVYHDMGHPLSHYFINSSHNTYLTGDQLQSDSDPKMYQRALLDGCRCVELDCWDGVDAAHPVIYHGFTRTSKISFDAVIDTIARNAFETSEYPVILSLELHVNHESQEHMAAKMKSAFGAALAMPSWPSGGSDPSVVVSPEAYKRRIILKSKRASADPDAEDDDDDDDGGKPDEVRKNKRGQKHSAVSKALSDLVIMEGCHFKGYDDPSAVHFQCCSIVETKCAGMATSHGPEFAAYNNRRLTRVYPSGARIDSSNMHPQVHWNAGCQLVAMNWQSTTGYELRLNKGRFRDNCNTGYLLKPDCLLKAAPSRAEYWTLEILSAFCLPKPMGGDSEIVDPYVYAFVEGPQHNKDQVLKTTVVADNGFHPVWRGTGPKSQMTFKVAVPELSTLVVQVWDSDTTGIDDFLVECFLPCHLIRPGIRCLSLRDIKSQLLRDSCLMVKLSVSSAPPASAMLASASASASASAPVASPASGGETPAKSPATVTMVQPQVSASAEVAPMDVAML